MSSKHATLSTAFPFLAGAVTALLVQNFLQKKKERASRENGMCVCVCVLLVGSSSVSIHASDITV
jgi:hypothetical protein